MILFWARANPQRPAIIQPDMIITYQGLAAAIASVVERLKRHDLDPQEPIAIEIESPAKLLPVFFALLHLRIPPAPITRGLLPFLRSAGILGVPPHRVAIFTLKNRTLSPAGKLFIECVREVAKPLARRRW